MSEKNLNLADFSEEILLLKQVAQGCKSSFNILYEKYWGFAYDAAVKRLKDADQAKDIVQEIFTHIWIKRETLHINNLPAYLHVAVRNKVFKLAAKQKLSHPFFDILENISEIHMQADSNLLTKEFFEAYEELINKLPSKRQIIFRLRFNEELSTKDIASRLGLSRKTVQNQLTTAIEKMKITLFYILIVLFSLLGA